MNTRSDLDPLSSPSQHPAQQLQPTPRSTPAFLLSMVFHVILMTGIGLFLAHRQAAGSGEEADRPVGIAMVHRLPDRTVYVDTAEVTESEHEVAADESAASSSAPSAAPADFVPPLDLAGVLEAIKTTPSPVSGTGFAGESDLDGEDFGSLSGQGEPLKTAKATTSLFGVSGSGSKFVYVFDRSDSMNGFAGKPLRAAKTELIRSLTKMTDRQQFQLIFYNDQPTPLRLDGSVLSMMNGDEPSIIAAQQYIRSINAYGGTEHMSALDMAIRLGPDVIFFLTDARIPRLSASQLRQIQRRTQRSGVTIHAIEFGTDPVTPTDSFLQDLAQMNGGQYKYVDVRILP